MAIPTPGQQPEPPQAKTLDYLSCIDLSTLTQSELLALSRSSSFSTAAIRFASDHGVASIERSTFNESSGSRRQTFCRPGPSSPSSSAHHRSRVAVAGRLSSSSAKSLAVADAALADTSNDPHNGENRRIIANLKQYLGNLAEFYDIDFDYVPPSLFTNPSLSSGLRVGERKRKRGRKPKLKRENVKPNMQKSVPVTSAMDEDTEAGLQIVNKNGVRVDLAPLASLEDPYGPEIRRRTEGMRGEEELLGFLSDLSGEWCSRRRKRKIIDAGALGDFLPVGWKLLLALKRKERCPWVYCRRIVSPGGKHFLSCKEVSEYLRSYFEMHVESSTRNQDSSHVHVDGHGSISQLDLGVTLNDDAEDQSDKIHKVTAVLGGDSLEEVQVQNLLEWQKCNSTLDKKDGCLDPLLSARQKTIDRSKLESFVENDKTVLDLNRDGVKPQSDQLSSQQVLDSMSKDEAGLRISRMDALIEIAQNSMMETLSPPATESTERFVSGELNLVSQSEQPIYGSEHQMISLGDVETEDGLTIHNLDQNFQEKFNETVTTDGKMEIPKPRTYVSGTEEGSQLDVLTSLTAYGPSVTQSEAYPDNDDLGYTANTIKEYVSGNRPADETELVISTKGREASGVSLAPPRYGGDNNHDQVDLVTIDFGPCNDMLQASPHIKEALLPSQLEPSQDLQTCGNVFKGEDKPYRTDEGNDRVVRYGELQLDYMEAPKHSFVDETGYGTAFQFQNQEAVVGVSGGSSNNNLTIVCMWCGIEFNGDLESSEPQSDSIGYVCLSCKARISGQIGTPDATTSPITSHLF